ncbi:hypothetical protein [Streptomyces sp. B21-083]|uniref:hypothetical protein n=1 Tax=Streptomyces sp. B21-083 TaxID=3039410 RepID=UPI002FF1A213
MATDDYGQGITLMALTDAPSIPKAIADLAAGVIPRGVMRFASASTRGATLAGSFAPVEGMMTWLVAEKRLDVYDAAGWRQIPYFSAAPAVSNQVSMPASFTTGAFTDFASGNWAPLTTTIPASGRIAISIGAAVHNTVSSTATAWAGWRASGAALTEASSETNSISTWGGRTYATRRVIRTGLTPGASLTVTPTYQVSAAGTIGAVTRVSDGQLSVEPLP